MAGDSGFEPLYTASKAAVLPLDESPLSAISPNCRRSGSNRHESCPPMVFETIASAYSATSARNPVWSGRRGSNSRPPPWQGGILPLNYFRSEKCRGPESDWRHADFQSAALPTELPRHYAKNYTNYACLTQPDQG